jgi:hypothetical protein
MFAENVGGVLDRIGSEDTVLDIGGWARPFNRATHVIDTCPYETRGEIYRAMFQSPYQGPDREHFTRDTWIQRDICSREPFPFADKSLDFAICSHTLEDIRDPIWVCSEMVRVAKAGYIEVPSRIAESTRGWESPGIAGLTHHRWLVDIEGDTVSFLHKPHAIHDHWRHSFPLRFMRSLPERRLVSWLFWTDRFSFAETTPIESHEQTRAALKKYVDEIHPYPRWLVAASDISDAMQAATRRVVNASRWRLANVRRYVGLPGNR